MSIKSISFEFFDPEELVRWASVCVEGELHEGRLGTVTDAVTCETCGMKGHRCQGHFGHVRLAAPVFHHGYVNRVCSVLKCVHEDGSLDLHLKQNPRVGKVNARALGVGLEECDENGVFDEVAHIRSRLARLPAQLRLDAAVGYSVRQYTAKPKGCKLVRNREEDVTPEEAHAVLSAISDADARLLGFVGSRPEWLILTVLPVPPPQMRPTATLTGDQAQDDLTKRLQEILRTNVKALTSSGAPADLATLQATVIGYLDHDKRPATGAQRPQRSARPLMSLATRIKGKEGRFRGTLMGKRTNFSGRSVITGDPHLRLDEVGVPPQVAKVLTVPEVACAHNFARLRADLAAHNAHKDRGNSRRYIWRDGERYSTRFMGSDVQLRLGDIVERPLRDGDSVVFNRQPTLSKGSLLGFRARIMPYATFRMPLAVTPSFNADFDGDEMNLFVPQTVEASVEAFTVMNAASNIISAQGHHPQFAIVQDGLLGAYALTRDHVYLTLQEATSIVMALPSATLPPPATTGPAPMWSGRQLASLALPPGLDYRRACDHAPAAAVEIADGHLVRGTLTKEVLGTGGGGLIHAVWKRCGCAAAARMIDCLQFIAIAYLTIHGFSVGIGDAVVADGVAAGIKAAIGDSVAAAATDDDSVLLLERTKETAGNAARAAMAPTNALHWMTEAGSKGSTINITQISACLGQQRVEGKLIPLSYRGRTLPHYKRGSELANIQGRGFVTSNYLDGLAPDEMFFHAAGGREGLIDTAIKTSRTGASVPSSALFKPQRMSSTHGTDPGRLMCRVPTAQARQEPGERLGGLRQNGAHRDRPRRAMAVRRRRLGRSRARARTWYRAAVRRSPSRGRLEGQTRHRGGSAGALAAADEAQWRNGAAATQPPVAALDRRHGGGGSTRGVGRRRGGGRHRQQSRAWRGGGHRGRAEHRRLADAVDAEQVRLLCWLRVWASTTAPKHAAASRAARPTDRGAFCIKRAGVRTARM